MKRLKKLLMLALVVTLVAGMSLVPASAATTPVVTIDGTAIQFDAATGAPYIDADNRTQVPIRSLSNALGVANDKVTWDQATQTATINGNIKITMGSDTIKTAYGTIKMDTVAVNKDSRIYVPVRYVVNALGYDIEWNQATATANVVTKVDLTMAAAISLKGSLDEIVELYKAEKPNVKMTMNYDASGTLQKQIEEGAPIDLFFSAATSNMNALKEKELMNNASVKNLVQNKLVLVVPSDSKLKITGFEDLKNADVKKVAIGEPSIVPAGKYADQVITYLNMKDALKDKLVFAKNVAEVRTWVESGNVDAGAIYSTDAMVSGDKVIIVGAASEGSHDPIVYPVGVVKATKHSAAAQDFLNFLTTDVAKAAFVKHGYSMM